MKTKELFSITLKIIGLIAFWKSVQTFGTMITGIGTYSMIHASDAPADKSYMFAIVLTSILNFVLPLLVAIIFIFNTEKVLSIIKIDRLGNEIDLGVNRRVFLLCINNCAWCYFYNSRVRKFYWFWL